MKQRDPIKAQTKILWIRQSGLCFWCGLPMTRTAKLRDGCLDERRATLDHVVARGNGGEDKPENVVLACFSCNTLRSKFVMPALRKRVAELEALTKLQTEMLNKSSARVKLAEARVKYLDTLCERYKTYLEQPWWKLLALRIKWMRLLRVNVPRTTQ